GVRPGWPQGHSRRAVRGRPGRRGVRLAHVLADHVPAAQAGVRGAHGAVDHLGFLGHQPAVRANVRAEEPGGVQPVHVLLHRGVQGAAEDGHGLGHRAGADGDPAGRHGRLHPATGQAGGFVMTPLARKRLGKVVLNGLALMVLLFAVVLVCWVISTAFQANDQIFSTGFSPLPTHFTFEHLMRVLTEGVAVNSIWVYMGNSAIVALGTVLIGAVFSLLAATAVARFRFKGRTGFLFLLLVAQMIPAEALLIPLFLRVKALGLYDHLAGLILVNVGLTLPFGIW